ncbi:MAG: insulinase family protein [Phycisphaeraceae bacterium]|nr:insulinase family protein [Phycisphaeraceae bacterium]
MIRRTLRMHRGAAAAALALVTGAAWAQRTAEEARLRQEGLRHDKTMVEMMRQGGPIEFAPPLLGLELTPADVIDIEHFADAGVWSAWLSNGVRVLVRPMPERPNAVEATVLLAGGELLEPATQRGLSQGAARLMQRPETMTIDHAELLRVLTPRLVRLSFGARRDAISIRLRGEVRELVTGLELIHALLTEPGFAPDALDEWRPVESARLRRQRSVPGNLLTTLTWEVIAGSNRSPLWPARAEDIEAIEATTAREWVLAHGCHAPMCIAITGDIDAATAFSLASDYLGALPARPRIGPESLRDYRGHVAPEAALHLEMDMASQEETLAAAVGWFGADGDCPDTARRLQLITMALRLQLDAAFPRERAFATAAQFFPSAELERAGLVLAAGLFARESGEQLMTEFIGAIEGMIDDGVDRAAFDRARLTMAESAARSSLEMSHWCERMAEAAYRGLSINEIVSASYLFDALTFEECQEALRRLRAHGRPVRVVIRGHRE